MLESERLNDVQAIGVGAQDQAAGAPWSFKGSDGDLQEAAAESERLNDVQAIGVGAQDQAAGAPWSFKGSDGDLGPIVEGDNGGLEEPNSTTKVITGAWKNLNSTTIPSMTHR